MCNSVSEAFLDLMISVGLVISLLVTCVNIGGEENWITYFSSWNDDLYETVTHVKYLLNIAQYLALVGYFFNLLVLIGVYLAVVIYKKTSTKCACRLLLTFAASSLVALLSNIAAIVLVRIANDQFSLTVPSLMRNSLSRSNVSDECTNNGSSGVYWNLLQNRLQCCGVDNWADYQHVTWQPRSPDSLAPLSCCDETQGNNSPSLNSSSNSSEVLQGCLAFPNQSIQYYYQGCFYAVSGYVSAAELRVYCMGSFVAAQVILTIYVRMLYELFH